MTTSYNPTSVQQGFGAEIQINQNFTDIQKALNEAISRISSVNNAMAVDFDLAGKQILNLPKPNVANDPVRLQDVNSLAIEDVVQTLTFATAISVDTTALTYAKVTLTGNTTITFTGIPSDARPILMAFRQDGTGSRTVTFDGTRSRFSADLPAPTMSTGASKLDYVIFRYNADDDKFDFMALNRGF